ncbi:osteopetrosis-associated transmembrane protein 1 isoform X2 [Helicoverpa zea]|uniref:osteopetrosis-associated transmembrane protein 1 isoform X2 n=1 Tax=Helicoverpa zea TaxID=7113 RepID=UPI001F592FA0|nr:osteopetrosis-associated transmembrane protein 1 isoform X2 [Helicoverpa zea]
MLAKMSNYYCAFLLLFLNLNVLKADVSNKESEHIDLLLTRTGAGYLSPFPDNCSLILNDFADYAANLTKCSILNARPIRICEKCIEPYMNFHNKYQELMTIVVNGTSCKSIFISHDRLDAILEYHDNILSIWNKAHCSDCYNWTTPVPVLSNETIHFNQLFNETINCIVKYINPSSNDTQIVCDNCMQSYLKLDSFYKTLSADSIGTDSICMDIVDSMNATRSVWSKSLNCCKIRRTPEVIFLVCTGIISVLPIFYYLVLRFCSPMRDLPNVLKQSRFKQTILRSLGRTN